MEITQKGLEFIGSFEAFRSRPYIDAVGVVTIGYGTTVYPDGKKVTMKDGPVTPQEAASFKLDHIRSKCYPALKKYNTNLAQHEFDAMCSFLYNVGEGGIQNGNGVDTAIINWFKGDKSQAYRVMIFNALGRWNKGGGIVLPGLTRRREEEAQLFCYADYKIG